MTFPLLSGLAVTQAERTVIQSTQARLEELSAKAHPHYTHQQEFRPLAQQARAALKRLTADCASEITAILSRALAIVSATAAQEEDRQRATSREYQIGFSPSSALFGVVALEAHLRLSL